MSETRIWTLEELDAMAEEGAAAMVVRAWSEPESFLDAAATHRRGEFREMPDGGVQVALFSVAAQQTWYVRADSCSCPHWQCRCRGVEGAVCKHSRWAFPLGEPRFEPPGRAAAGARARREIMELFA